VAETVTERLARFVVQTEFKDLSKESVEMAKAVTLDTLGCAIGGYDNEPSSILRRIARELGGSESTVIGDGRASCENAIRANSVMATCLDYDDVWIPHTRNTLHAGNSIVPTALALGEREHLSGEQVILAIVLGYDVAMRLTEAARTPLLMGRDETPKQALDGLVERGERSIPVNVPFYNVAVAGKLLELDEDQMANAMGIIGCNIGVGTAEIEAGMTKCLRGWDIGIIAAFMAKYGFKSSTAQFEGKRGVCEWLGGCDLDALFGHLGKRFKITEDWIKPYPCQYSFHTALDLTSKLVKEHQLLPDKIRDVKVKSFLRASQMAAPAHYKPETPIVAQFSLPYCVALIIKHGNVHPDFFTEKKIRDPNLLELARRVKVELDPELDKIALVRGDLKRPSTVEIITESGERYKAQGNYPKGQYPNLMSSTELQGKYRMLASKLLQEDQIAESIKSINRLEKMKDVCEVMKPLAVKSK
jgi:2-methylcitrate dehydratase PrpD